MAGELGWMAISLYIIPYYTINITIHCIAMPGCKNRDIPSRKTDVHVYARVSHVNLINCLAKWKTICSWFEGYVVKGGF